MQNTWMTGWVGRSVVSRLCAVHVRGDIIAMDCARDLLLSYFQTPRPTRLFSTSLPSSASSFTRFIVLDILRCDYLCAIVHRRMG
jgi:hypothetical protein